MIAYSGSESRGDDISPSGDFNPISNADKDMYGKQRVSRGLKIVFRWFLAAEKELVRGKTGRGYLERTGKSGDMDHVIVHEFSSWYHPGAFADSITS